MARYAATQNAIEKGLDQIAPDAGGKLVDDWIEQLNGADVAGAAGIVKDLERLKTELGRGEKARGENVLKIVHKLGAATSKAADKAKGANVDKLKQLGEALTNAGQAHADGDDEAND